MQPVGMYFGVIFWLIDCDLGKSLPGVMMGVVFGFLCMTSAGIGAESGVWYRCGIALVFVSSLAANGDCGRDFDSFDGFLTVGL